MTTRFSLEVDLHQDEQHRLFQLFQYLATSETGDAALPPELLQYLAVDAPDEMPIEDHLAGLVGAEPIGIDIELVAPDKHRARIFDRAGAPNLRMLCQVIANIVPRILPLEFTFAVIDDFERYYSGGLVVMTTTTAEIQVVDSKLKRHRKKPLH